MGNEVTSAVIYVRVSTDEQANGPLMILAFWFGPPTAVKFGPLGQHWLGFMDGATEA
jgi:hypothetical protein